MIGPAAGAAAALTAMMFASRLPPDASFLLPRRFGWTLHSAAMALLSRPAGRTAYSALAAAALLAALGVLGRRLWLLTRGRKWSPAAFLGRSAGLAAVVILARWSFLIVLELTQGAWFAFGAVDLREPLFDLLALTAIFWAASSAAKTLLEPKPELARGRLLAWAGVNLAAAWLAIGVWGAWGEPPRAGSDRTTLYVALTEDGGKPGQAAYRMPEPASSESLDALASGKRGRRLETLRYLYEQRARRMEPEPLRAALLAGAAAGDPLAPALLLDHLEAAPPGDDAKAALGFLSDGKRWRIGPRGAARLAKAWTRFGDGRTSGRFAIMSGMPRELLALEPNGALAPGRISGRAAGARRPARVALYRRFDAAAPYLLDAGALAAAAPLGPDGRFSFSGLGAGRYYLAFAFEAADPREELRASGWRGDVVLDPRRPAAELPPLTFKAAP